MRCVIPAPNMKGATVADFRERFVITEAPVSQSVSPTWYRLQASSEIGSLDVKYIVGRHLSLSRGDLKLKHNATIEVNDNLVDKVGIYMLEYGRGGMPIFGESRYSDSGWVNPGECYLAYNPSLNEIHQFDAQIAKPLYLEVSAEYFASLMDESDRYTSSLKEKIARRELFGMKTAFTAAQQSVVSAMYNCQFQGSLGNLMLEGAFQQFIAIHLARFTQPCGNNERLTPADRDIIHAVKDHLDGKFRENHSLLDLSKEFGINQNKLKKVFKETFGVPVIEYLYDLKMNHARELLMNEARYVGEVASIVGYRNANHFATAFKRKFGVSPSKI